MTARAAPARVATGLEACIQSPPDCLLASKRIGLLMHQASVDAKYQYANHRLMSAFGAERIQRVFSPQHGIFGEQQANMIETPHATETGSGMKAPVFSLYSETRRPTPEMLQGLDLFVIDLQDVGTRVYTYIWTVMNCLEACGHADLPVLILDRPNPLGGKKVEGPILKPEFFSFVGQADVPMRHGLTLGEFARLLNAEHNLGASLQVVPMSGWRREMLWPETGLAWIPPSPNMPTFASTAVYPGQVLLEGTNLSEGRGTTIPFEVLGAPFIDPTELLAEVEQMNWSPSESGVTLRAVYFQPTFDKWSGQSCGGVAWHPSGSYRDFDSYGVTTHLLAAIRRRWPNDFAWLPPPYEYETEKPPIDILSGDTRLREWIDAREDRTETRLPDDLIKTDAASWWARAEPHLLYD